MTTSSLARRSLRVLARLTLPLSLLAALAAGAQTLDLADKPLFSTTSVPGNLLLDLSVEYPTANSSAYFSTTPYSSSTLYLGYFDGAKCYKYVYGPNQTPTFPAANSYFQASSLASSHTCTSSASAPVWSGNWLNYASMQGLDIFRWVLTGGNRTTDQTAAQGGMTILTRSTHSGQGGAGDAPNKTLAQSDEKGATPFNWTAQNNTRVWGAATQLWITGNTTDITGNVSPVDYKAQHCNNKCNTSSDADSDGNVYSTTVYRLYMNVRVCDTTVSLESNCVLYGSVYKPEGLMQQYSQTLRYGAFGYLNDSNVNRDGGVLRARMAYIGPTQPVPGSAPINNTNPEWDGTTGVMAPNPDPTDATATNTFTQGFSSSAGSISSSGVMNYLNQFGYAAANINLSTAYKTYDPVSELYYASIRYLKGLSNVSSYTDMTGASASTINTWVDGSPVITKWTDVSSNYDPIVYSCQKNFILGIGDVNTHHDGNLPGSSLLGQEPAMPPEVSADTSIDVPAINGSGVTGATNTVGIMEGTTSTLGKTYLGDYATYYIAGLAYDGHIPLAGHGVRTNSDSTISTVSTYWLDVQEYQTYVNNNQYYYATKYGGYTLPNPFPASYTYGTVPPQASWYTTSNMQGSNKQPDNYFTAANAPAMQAGLTNAFAKIASENNTAYGTALSVPTPNVVNNNAASYATNYDPHSWTGQLLGYLVTLASDGTPTLTQQWDAGALLSASTTARKIVTCCTSSTTSPGLAFTYAALSAATTAGTLSANDYYTSFASVPGTSCSAGTVQCTTNYIAYLRGDTTQELGNVNSSGVSGAYRARASLLGDIVNSKPVVVGTPAYQFYDNANPGYSAFKAKYANRQNVVFAGSNDGMLHAFNGSITVPTVPATTPDPNAGQELFAYIPSFAYGTSSTAATTGLASLGNPSFVHHYLVDAPAGEFDVDFGNTYQASVTTPDWRTIIIGGLGKGGKGIYALDVTDPTSWTSETAVASKVLWEFTDSHLGYTYGTPSVVKTKKYGWTVVFTSGYSNADGMGYIFFVNPKTGKLLEMVSTPANSGTTAKPLNMGEQSAYVPDYTDQTADAIYAGDVQGNVWRVDVTGTDPTVAYSTALQFAKFGNTQPITTRPLIEIAQNSTVRYVLVGTGKLLADSDISTSATQSFYAMVDGFMPFGAFYGTTANPLPSGVSFPLTRSQLNADSDPTNLGITSNPTSVMGWYIDLPVTTNPAIAQRVNVDPTADQGYVAFIGNTPNGVACNPSGTGVVYTFQFATGQSVLTNIDGSTALNAQLVSLGTDVAILGDSGTMRVYTGDNKGNAFKVPTKLKSTTGVVQINWRDVPSTN